MHTMGAVPFIFGCFGARRLPGPVLVQALTDLGIPAPTARTVLARMARAGEVTPRRQGRASTYELSGGMRRRFERIRGGRAGLRWEGHFHVVVYEVPESRRRQRDALRSIAFEHDFAPLRPGVLAGLEPAAAWLAELPESETLPLLEVGTFACDEPTARRIARRCWPVDETRRELAERVATTRLAIERARQDAGSPSDALRNLFEVFGTSAISQLRTPALPPELLPAPWPGDELAHLSLELAEAHLPAVARYVREAVVHSPYRDLIVWDERAADALRDVGWLADG